MRNNATHASISDALKFLENATNEVKKAFRYTQRVVDNDEDVNEQFFELIDAITDLKISLKHYLNI